MITAAKRGAGEPITVRDPHGVERKLFWDAREKAWTGATTFNGQMMRIGFDEATVRKMRTGVLSTPRQRREALPIEARRPWHEIEADPDLRAALGDAPMVMVPLDV